MNSKKDKEEFVQKMATPPAGIQTSADAQNPMATIAETRHRLRTPLNHIIGYSEILIEEAEENQLDNFAADLRKIHAAGKQLLGNLDQLFGSNLTRSKPTNANETFGAGEIAPPSTVVVDSMPHVARSGHILVVDDDPGNRDILVRRLEHDGYTVQSAVHGEDALARIATEPVDLILLDVMMPGMSGYEVLAAIKGESKWHDIPVIMISALDELQSVVRCIERGAEDYLPKPFDPILLRARIGACLEKKRLRDQEIRLRRELAEWNQTLAQRVQEQVTQLERLGRLKRFFSPQLAELIVSGDADDPLKTHRREITVVYLDLRGFTAFAETAEPEELMGVLREYHAAMGELILEYQATLEHFAGDGMLIFFNDPTPISKPAEQALRMALAMRERVKELRTKWRKIGYDLDFSVGIAQGYATIGSIGFEGRWEYGAVGSVPNLAARLCGEAKPGEILVSQRVLAALDELVDVEEKGELALKGFHRPVPAYNILGPKS